MVSPEYAHLPKCPIDPERYERLYAFNQNLDDQMPESPDWKEIRIKPGLPEEEVYRLFPSAPDFEYSGYLSKRRIRFFRGDSHSTGMMMAKPCTFHSQPTKNPYLADIPSLQDIYSFLYYRHLRSLTVGATKIWVWDKTKATLRTVQKMASWIEANHFRVVNRLMKKDFATWQGKYVQTVLHHLGWVWPETIDAIMKLIVHRGSKEIGGSCVELTTATTRLVLDLGLPLVDANREPFDSRAALVKSIDVLKAEKVIPSIDGLFDTDHPAPDGIMLSHAHLDHAGLLHLSRTTVPIFATSGTSKMMLAAAVFAGQKQLDRTRFREVVS